MSQNSSNRNTGESAPSSGGIVDRRKFLSATVGGSLVTIAGCAGDDGDSGTEDENVEEADEDWDESELEGMTLDVTVWSGTFGQVFEEVVAPIYEDQYGVDLTIHHEWAELLANIRAAPEDDPPYDVAVADGNFYFPGIQEELYLPIREENVPNMEEIYPHLLDTRTHEYGVPIDAGPMALIWTDDYEFSGEHPTSFSDLLSEDAQEANTAMEGSSVEYPVYTAAIASDRGLSAIEEGDWDYVFDTLDQKQIDQWIMGGADLWEWLDTGEVEFAQYYTASGWTETQEREDWNIHFPENNLAYLDHYCVVRGTDKRRAAEHYINWLASEECQSAWAAEYPQLMSNQNVEYSDFGGIEENFPTTNEEWQDVITFDWDILLDQYDDLDDRYQRSLLE